MSGSKREQKVLNRFELISLETLEAFMGLGLYQTICVNVGTIFSSLVPFFVRGAQVQISTLGLR